MTHLLEATARGGRRATKFTPANIEKIIDLVAQGVSREQIAQLLDVPLGSLQVTCSRLGISLRRRDASNKVGERRIFVTSRSFVSDGPLYNGHMGHRAGRQAKFQLVLERRGKERTIDLPITASELQQLGLEASLQDLSIAELMGQVLANAIKKNVIREILRDEVPSFER